MTLASNKLLPVRCPACDRIVKRRSRQQTFCSTRCRNKAHKTPWTLKTPVRYHPSQEGTDPHKSSNENNILQWPKSRSRLVPSDGIVGPRQVIGAEIIAGREWEDVVSSGGVKSYVSRLTRRALVI